MLEGASVSLSQIALLSASHAAWILPFRPLGSTPPGLSHWHCRVQVHPGPGPTPSQPERWPEGSSCGYTPNSKTRNRITGTNCTENAVSCVRFRGVAPQSLWACNRSSWHELSVRVTGHAAAHQARARDHGASLPIHHASKLQGQSEAAMEEMRRGIDVDSDAGLDEYHHPVVTAHALAPVQVSSRPELVKRAPGRDPPAPHGQIKDKKTQSECNVYQACVFCI
eukprot:100360-Rhodomonas_salina.1